MSVAVTSVSELLMQRGLMAHIVQLWTSHSDDPYEPGLRFALQQLQRANDEYNEEPRITRYAYRFHVLQYLKSGNASFEPGLQLASDAVQNWRDEVRFKPILSRDCRGAHAIKNIDGVNLGGYW